MPVQNNPLDPDWIASQEFDTSFRGFDQGQVRKYLRELALSLRTELQERQSKSASAAAQSKEIADYEDRLTTLSAEAAILRGKLDEANQKVEQLEAAPAKIVPTELDPGQLNQLLGEETVRVLDSARSAAADIRAKAEKEAAQRSAELDKVQRETTSKLAEVRKLTDEETAAQRAAAEADSREVLERAQEKAKKLVSEAEATAKKLMADAEAEATKKKDEAATSAQTTRAAAADVAAAVKLRGEDVAKKTRLAAEANAEKIHKEAEQIKSDAEAEGARLRAEVAADVDTARDAAREEARLMLTEAQALREKVLEDLVRRRRIARQQIDQAKAARDRLAKALLVAGQQIAVAATELDISVPEAKRAMEQVGQRPGATDEAEQMENLAHDLDQARTSGTTLSAEVVAGASVQLESTPSMKTETESAQADKDGSKGAKQKGEASVSDFAGDGRQVASSKGRRGAKNKSGSRSSELDNEDLVVDLVDEGVEAVPSDALHNIFDRIRAEHDEERRGAQKKEERRGAQKKVGEPAVVNKPKADEATRVTEPKRVTEPAQGKVESESKEPKPSSVGSTKPSGDDKNTSGGESELEILPAFADRDIALTRYGPDLRRKLKRALADDQSDVLDRLRRAKKPASNDLPNTEEQLAGFRKSTEPGLLAMANAGAESLGGKKVRLAEIAEMAAALAKALHTPLRAKVERTVAAGGNADEVLEPVRAHYRDARSSSLPGLLEDAMAEAFALGLYGAIKDKAKLVWVVDPRATTSPDCFDNTLEESVVKPGLFPTGHQRPLGGPGCRCLVLPADSGE